MFRDFSALIKELEKENKDKWRGWSLQKLDGANSGWYFSKFDDKFSDDEYQIHIEWKDSGIELIKSARIRYHKGNKKEYVVEASHPFVTSAEELAVRFWVESTKLGKKLA
jgi:hypothetical protein